MNQDIKTTDQIWESWGATDPYFGVLTHEAFRGKSLNDHERQQFFSHGVTELRNVFVKFMPQDMPEGLSPNHACSRWSVLDFGCGVGRLTRPLAHACNQVLALDVSRSMLNECAKNCAHLKNVAYYHMVDHFPHGVRADFVITSMVLQHIEPPRGLELLKKLLECCRQRFAIHLPYRMPPGVHDHSAMPSFAYDLSRVFEIFERHAETLKVTFSNHHDMLTVWICGSVK